MIKTGAPNGYLYNWYAATAGTGAYSVSSGSVSSSICPKGWTLPTGGPSSQFVDLVKAYGGDGENHDSGGQQTVRDNLMTIPIPGLNWTGYRLGGSINNSSLDQGYYWSHTASSSTQAYYLAFDINGSLGPQFSNFKFFGFAVRCIRQESMQNFTPDSSAATGTTKDLVDLRDNKTYKVGKLEDGNWWMVQDLKLDGLDQSTGTNRVLTSADSNVSTPFTLLAENTGTWCTDETAECYNQSLMIKTGVPNGYLYNWYAATAGTGTYSVSSGSVSSSICPKGWTLPTGGPNGQFSALSVAYGGPTDGQDNQQTAINNLRATPIPGFNWTGYRGGNSIGDPSDRALYWSRTANSSASVHDLGFRTNGRLNPQSSDTKRTGLAIRCVAST